jgi:gas vesicle protein
MFNRTTDILKGLVIGGLVGTVLGILFAPKGGKETRENLARKTEKFRGKAREEYEKAIDKSKSASEPTIRRIKELEASMKEKLEDAEKKASDLVERGKIAIQHNTDRMKKG